MRKLISIVLTISLAFMGLAGCASKSAQSSEQSNSPEVASFKGLDDPELLQFTADAVVADLESSLESDDYQIEEVQAVYVSKEYLEELAYNSQSNIYFGYTLAEIEEQLGSQKFVFTVGDDGQTTVKAFENYDDTFEKIATNLAVGGGVILVCVVVSVATGGAAAPAAVQTVNMVFVASAKTAAAFAAGSGAIGFAAGGITKALETGDAEGALKAAALRGSEDFKWGAIVGAVAGGAGKALQISKASKVIPSPREAELAALKKYPGREQVSFLNGQEVPINTPGATRPDIITEINGEMVAVEVKRYDLVNNFDLLDRELTRQVTSRVSNLPSGYSQRIVLNTQGRTYSQEFLDQTVKTLSDRLTAIDPTVVIEVMG